MTRWSAADFAARAGCSVQAARLAFRNASKGKFWHGYVLPVVSIDGRRGGVGGKVWELHIDVCSDPLRAKLGLPSTSPRALEEGIETRPNARQIAVALAKQRTIEPILKTARGSPERAAAFREVASQQHAIGGRSKLVKERTLREWVKDAEVNVWNLVPADRGDKGQHRVLITRRWDQGCGLAEDVRLEVADKLEKTARGLLLKGRSERNTATLCTAELQRLTAAAGGVSLSKARMGELCYVSLKWVRRFGEMKVVALAARNNKPFSDKHEYHVTHHLTERPLEVLMGDVHTVDVTIGGLDMKAWLIGWMDGSSGYLWATLALTARDKAITQQDVARSLYDVLTCPWGGMPDAFRIDNGGEFKFLGEAVLRYGAMAAQLGPNVVKCRPHHPEGKARLERAFGQLEQTFISALPGYNGGNPLKPRLKARGKPVDPYTEAAGVLAADMALALAQFNGTAQQGALGDLSPKGMLEAKIAATGWRAQQIDPNDDLMFDLVFSHEEPRDVLQGSVTIGRRKYTGNVLTELLGHKHVPILVPYRDPTGPVLILHEGKIHRLTHDTVAMNDLGGAIRKSEMVRLQKDELARRTTSADPNVDVQELLSAAADLGPVEHNPPDTWRAGILDKGGFLTKPLTDREAQEREYEDDRAFIETFVLDRGEGPAGATASPSCAA